MWPKRKPRLAPSRPGGVHHPAPAVALHRHDPRLLGPQALGVGLRRLHAAELERHDPVDPDASDRPPRRPGPLVGLAQLDLVVRRALVDAPHQHGATASTGTRPSGAFPGAAPLAARRACRSANTRSAEARLARPGVASATSLTRAVRRSPRACATSFR